MLRYLYEVVEKHYKNGGLQDNQTSFLDILTEVAARMSEKTYYGQKMYTIVPCLVHKLYMDIIFTQGKNMVQQGEIFIIEKNIVFYRIVSHSSLYKRYTIQIHSIYLNFDF